MAVYSEAKGAWNWRLTKDGEMIAAGFDEPTEERAMAAVEAGADAARREPHRRWV